MTSYYKRKIGGFCIFVCIFIVFFDPFTFFQRKIIFTYYLL